MVNLPSLRSRGPTGSRDEECDACGSCVGRREFFRIGLGAAAAAAFLGGLPEALAGEPVRWIEGSADGDLVRYPIPAEDGVHVDRKEELILVRYKGEVEVFELSCPHQRSLLKWRPKDHIFRCTKHHSEYSPTGVYLKGRATRNMDRLAVRLDGSDVVADKGTVYHSDDDPKGWAAAEVSVS